METQPEQLEGVELARDILTRFLEVCGDSWNGAGARLWIERELVKLDEQEEGRIKIFLDRRLEA